MHFGIPYSLLLSANGYLCFTNTPQATAIVLLATRAMTATQTLTNAIRIRVKTMPRVSISMTDTSAAALTVLMEQTVKLTSTNA